MLLNSKNEEVEAKYDVSLNYPNLELHSAAASGNVGLVHYALTHGQPVNSVLHGVLPLHAACSGGSLSVVKMLIDRGADVNAPRLPRRYSEGKKTNVPSIGAAGSTPLHFAAANGHAQIAQILLTCGAVHNKMDKNGMTPEALAEINGHTEVIRVLRVWEHLKATDPSVASLAPSPYVPSDSLPSSPIDDEARSFSFASRKGKERAFSFVSNASDTTSQAGRIRNSLEGLLRGKSSRAGSFASGFDVPRFTPLTANDSAVEDELPSNNASPRTSTSYADPSEEVDETYRTPNTAASNESQTAATRILDTGSAIEDDETSPLRLTAAELGPSPSKHNPSTSGSSRRPSLPSILEKAVHPGAAFRAALRRDHHRPPPIQTTDISAPIQGPSPVLTKTISPSSGSDHGHHHGFFRGRHKSNESTHAKSKHTHKYMSKHALVSLFKRSHSPHSRSPSPPTRSESSKGIDPDQMEENMEKMRRASLDLDMRQNGSALIETELHMPRLPVSAPPTQTSFFTSSIAPPIPSPNAANIPLPDTPLVEEPPDRLPASVSMSERRTKSRQGSEVIAPSPLANEWAVSSDSDTPSVGVRRAKTESARSSTPSLSLQSASPRPPVQPYHAIPSSPLRHPGTRLRAVTSPSTPVGASLARSASGTKLIGLNWNDAVDLRKVASLRRETKKQLEREERYEQEREKGQDGEDEEVFDAQEETEDESTPEASQFGEAPTHRSDETEKGEDDDDIGDRGSKASLGVAMTESRRVESSESTKSSVRQGRYRGASIGSMSATTESSRISTPPSSSARLSSLHSDEEPRSPTYPYPPYGYTDLKPVIPAPLSEGGRARGKSVSSTSSNQTDMSISYFLPSTPGTSLTPQSTLSMPHGRFPPVPENEVAHHPTPHRRVSNRQEARQAKKRAEEDVLQLAQLPPSLDSTRSLAAQLAAYGESLELEEKFAKRERRLKGSTSGEGEAGSDSESYFSARSDVESAGTGSVASKPHSRRSKASPSLSNVPADLLPPNAPKSSLKSINSIYDKRAAAYRDRMAALTALPPTFPTGMSSSASSKRGPTGNNPIEAWMVSGTSHKKSGVPVDDEVDRHRDQSTPRSVKPVESIASRKKSSLGQLANSVRQSSLKSNSPSAPSSTIDRTRAGNRSTRTQAPAPIADVVQTRYMGMSPPPNVPQPPRLESNSPFISIFSHRYSGSPHDGDDSDDEEQGPQTLTVIENDWRGVKALGHDDSFEKKGRWGQFKGAIGHLGHRKVS